MPAPDRPAAPAAPAPWSRRTEIAAIVGFWAMLGALSLLRRLLDPRGPQGLATPEFFLTLSEYALWAALTPVIFGLARRLPIEREAWARRVALHLVIALAGAACVELVEQLVLHPLFRPEPPFGARPGRGPFRTMFRPGPGEILLRLWFLDEFVVFVAVLAAGFARDYFLRYREHQAEAARLEAQLAEARLSALRMQLNPHFLFNTLHAVSALVERDPAGVRLMVARLSALLRHVLDGSPAQEVPLRDELAFLRLYLDIQRVRFQGRLEVVEDVEPAALDALVPNLLLQPLVENAVEHGVSRVEDGLGRVEVRARIEPSPDGPDRLVVTVRDNGPGPGPSGTRGSGVGLANTEARLAALYGGAAGLRLAAAPDGGASAVVTLPYHTAADLRALAADA
ncbi:MAG TPA: histidine kinase [Rubricoccaceae bacterium]|nr:histidine kinase [Rubricoccaceae bacterium]